MNIYIFGENIYDVFKNGKMYYNVLIDLGMIFFIRTSISFLLHKSMLAILFSQNKINIVWNSTVYVE